jgi:hypothetical protein
MTAQTRSPRRTFNGRLAAAVTGVVVLATGLSACSTAGSAPDSASGAITESVDVKEAGIGTDIAEFLARNVASGIVGAGGAKVFNSVVAELFGDPTAAKLDEIDSQLTAVSGQISALQAQVGQLQSTVDSNYYNEVARNLEQQINAINELQIQKLQGIVVAAKSLEQAKGTTGEADAKTNLDRAKADFVQVYASNFAAYSAIATNIYQVLLPAGAITDKSILKARGAVLLNKGYIDSRDSEDLRRLQDVLAQEQALAVYLNAEYLALNGQQPEADALVTRWADEWQPAQEQAMPPTIPYGTVIPTKNHNLTGALEFRPGTWSFNPNTRNWNMEADATSWMSDPWNFDALAKDSTDSATDISRQQILSENPDWAFPTGAQLVDLWAIGINGPGANAAQKVANQVVRVDSEGQPAEDMDNRWEQVFGPVNTVVDNPWWGRIWTSDKASCDYPAWSGLKPTAITDWRGAIPSGAGCWEVNPQTGAPIPSERFASVVLVKPVTEDYMAQG